MPPPSSDVDAVEVQGGTTPAATQSAKAFSLRAFFKPVARGSQPLLAGPSPVAGGSAPAALKRAVTGPAFLKKKSPGGKTAKGKPGPLERFFGKKS
jgi:hypothetical protein